MIFRSGPFELDIEAARLTRSGTIVPLSAQPMAVLAALMGTPDRVVTRAELKALLWPGSDRIDTERRLNTTIRSLREALEDTAETARFIQTVRRQGYRWIAAPEASRRGKFWRAPLAAPAALLLLAFFAGPLRHDASPTPEQSARLVALSARAAEMPNAVAGELDRLVADHPSLTEARILRAQLAVQRWRNDASAEALEQSRRTIDAARRRADNATLDVLRAEVALKGDWNWKAAETAYRRALKREPSNIDARRGLAWLLLNAGRSDAAMVEAGALMASTALTPALRADLGWLMLRMGRNEIALSLCGEHYVHEINLLACRHTVLARLGQTTAARDNALLLMERLNADARDTANVRNCGAATGYQRFLEWRVRHFPVAGAFQRAQLLAEAGQLDDALISLERAYAEHDPALFKLGTSPEFDQLRGSPRFQTLLHAIGAANI